MPPTRGRPVSRPDVAAGVWAPRGSRERGGAGRDVEWPGGTTPGRTERPPRRGDGARRGTAPVGDPRRVRQQVGSRARGRGAAVRAGTARSHAAAGASRWSPVVVSLDVGAAGPIRGHEQSALDVRSRSTCRRTMATRRWWIRTRGTLASRDRGGQSDRIPVSRSDGCAPCRDHELRHDNGARPGDRLPRCPRVLMIDFTGP